MKTRYFKNEREEKKNMEWNTQGVRFITLLLIIEYENEWGASSFIVHDSSHSRLKFSILEVVYSVDI